MRKLAVITLFLVCWTTISRAQVPEFSQFYAAPVYLNPALAGVTYNPRISINYRNQWPSLGNGINGGFVSYQVSYDQHVEAIKGGIGVSILADRISTFLNKYSFAATYAAQIRFSRKLGLKLALSGAFHQNRLDWNSLYQHDQNNSLVQYAGLVTSLSSLPSTSPFENNTRNFADIGLGMLLLSPKFYAGLSVSRIGQNDESFNEDGSSIVPVKTVLHLGGVMRINNQQDRYFSPNALASFTNQSAQFNVSGLLNIEHFHGGMAYRYTIKQHSDVILLMGFKKGIVRVGYSVDIPTDELSGISNGAHELSMTIQIGGDDNSVNPRNRHAIIDCPDVLKF